LSCVAINTPLLDPPAKSGDFLRDGDVLLVCPYVCLFVICQICEVIRHEAAPGGDRGLNVLTLIAIHYIQLIRAASSKQALWNT